jgi:peroxiredoxin
MQDFELTDQDGQPFELVSRLQEKPLVLVFYRGDWWPYCNGQLVSFARSYEEFEQRGFGVVGISVDPPGHNEAMVDKLDLPYPLLSDPRGDLIKGLDLWNEEEAVSEPAVVVLDGSAMIRHLYTGGTDFSDRPPEEEPVRPEKPAITLDELGPYYLGTYFATVAMQKKLEGQAKEEGDDFQDLVTEYNAAVQETAEEDDS